MDWNNSGSSGNIIIVKHNGQNEMNCAMIKVIENQYRQMVCRSIMQAYGTYNAVTVNIAVFFGYRYYRPSLQFSRQRRTHTMHC
jgi:hypothetical protein